MSYATIDDLRSQLGGGASIKTSTAYAAKMLHDLPPAKTVDRAAFILKHVTGKRVLEFGASGPLHEQIKAVAGEYFGVDRQVGDRVVAFDLDSVQEICVQLPTNRPEIIVCGEILEHLGNPQYFLSRLRAQFPGVPVMITVPNAFAQAGRQWLAKGKECVNGDHVAWYSPKTLSVLLARVGYTYAELFYYNGEGPTAEGLVVVTE
jgi:hypothetical protein